MSGMPAFFGYEKNVRILIVDDDLHVLAVLEDLFLMESDFEVKAVSDSREAISLIQNEHFDIVISDLMMPKIDGLAITRSVLENSPESLVIIITGFASLETTLEAIHLGVYDYITKPFQIDEFRLLVNNASSRVRLERENRFLRQQLAYSDEILQRVLDSQSVITAELTGLRQQLAATPGPIMGMGKSLATSNLLEYAEKLITQSVGDAAADTSVRRSAT